MVADDSPGSQEVTIESSWSATVHENRSERSATPVSVLGLGMLGSELARAFLDHGHATTVWNRSHGKADDLVAGGAIRAATAPTTSMARR